MTTPLPRVPLGEAIAAHAARDPGAPAVLAAGRAWTYGDLAARVAAGTPRPGVVIVERDDPAELVVAAVTTASLSAAAPLGGHPPEVREALRERLAAFAPGSEVRAPDVEDHAFVYATSGTTAAPKLVPNTHRNVWASATVAATTHALAPGDRGLAMGAMTHVLGLRAVTDILFCGAAVIVPADLRVDTLAPLLREHLPTFVAAGPPGVDAFTAALERLGPGERAKVVAGIRFVKSASAALRPAVAERLARILEVPVLSGYGMTEVAKICATRLGVSAPEGSVGPVVGVEVRLDPVADVAGPGRGEIVVRGDTVAPGYLDDRHRSASGFEPGGWFRTGDLGRLDEEGNVFLLGRRDDLVSRGGEMVSLGVVEAALEEHPQVASALAAALPHPSLGMDVAIGYVIAPGADDPGAEGLRRFLAERLPTGQVPNRLLALDEIPLTGSRKPSRAALVARCEGDIPAVGRTQGAEIELAGLWAAVLGIEVPTEPWDDFFALGGGSLALLELCEQISVHFGVEVAPGELVGGPTLREMTEALGQGGGRRHGHLVPLRAGDPGRLRLYVVPGRGGTLAAVQRFVHLLDPGRPVVGFEAPGIYDGERPARRVRAQARTYVGELLADTGPEPFALLGSSFGALVVQEMARLLEACGRAPEVVVMVDATRPRWRRWLRRRAAQVVRRPVAPERTAPIGRRIQATKDAAADAGGRHRPRATRSPTVLITSEARRSRTGDPLLGWGPLLHGEVTTLDFPGRHTELIRERSHQTAPALDAALARYDRVPATPVAVP